MPAGLSIREQVMLAIEARDRASAVINNVSGSVQGMSRILEGGSLRAFAYSQAFDVMGRSMTRWGLAAIAAVAAAGKATFDFQHAMALANTQAHLTTQELATLSKQALDVSSTFGIAGTEIADSLYDIFSTTDQTAGQAIQSVQDLAKASVAGATEMRTVTRGVIDIQNAFGEAAGSTTDILNLQFQMLRKSAGTYDELVSAFGNVIGAAVQTNQEIETVSGAIGFLTLRGRTQAQSAISVSRALDQIVKSAGALGKVLDVEVFDTEGDFRQLNDIITDMGKAMADMSSQEQAAALRQVFGQGSIQANRFFRTAIPQFHELNASVDELSDKNIAGQLETAFQIMVDNDPTFVFRRLVESVKNFGITVFTTMIPAIRDFIDRIQQGVDWLNNLDDATKNLIGRGVLLAGVVLLVSGRILTLVGTITRLMSVFQLAQVSMLGAAGIAGGVVVAVLAIVAAIGWMIINWNKVGPTVTRVLRPVIDFLQDVWAIAVRVGKALVPPFMAFVDVLIQIGRIVGSLVRIIFDFVVQLTGAEDAADFLNQALEVLEIILEHVRSAVQFVADALHWLADQLGLVADASDKAKGGIAGFGDSVFQALPGPLQFTKVLFDMKRAWEEGKPKAEASASAVMTMTEAVEGARTPTRELGAVTGDLADAHKNAAQQAKNQRIQENLLAGNMLGVIEALEAAKEAQNRVNRMRARGKTDNKEYRDALQDVLTTKLQAIEAVRQYKMDLEGEDLTQQQVERHLRDLARQLDLTKEEFRRAISPINEVAGGLERVNRLPRNFRFRVDITTRIRELITSGQTGGSATETREGGGGGGGGGGGTTGGQQSNVSRITVNVDGTTREAAEIVAREIDWRLRSGE